MTHFTQTLDLATRRASATGRPMAVVHYGCGEYVVKTAALAEMYYPQSIRLIVQPSGETSDNPLFDNAAL